MNEIEFKQPLVDCQHIGIGDMWANEDDNTNVYMLCLLNSDSFVALMNLRTGSPRHPGIKVENFHNISAAEWKLITGISDKKYVRIRQKLTIIPE